MFNPFYYYFFPDLLPFGNHARAEHAAWIEIETWMRVTLLIHSRTTGADQPRSFQMKEIAREASLHTVHEIQPFLLLIYYQTLLPLTFKSKNPGFGECGFCSDPLRHPNPTEKEMSKDKLYLNTQCALVCGLFNGYSAGVDMMSPKRVLVPVRD